MKKQVSASEIQSQIKALQRKLPVQVSAGEYNGHAMVNFEGNMRPFAISARKAKIILDNADAVRAIVGK
jgi:hypothetical protein